MGAASGTTKLSMGVLPVLHGRTAVKARFPHIACTMSALNSSAVGLTLDPDVEKSSRQYHTFQSLANLVWREKQSLII